MTQIRSILLVEDNPGDVRLVKELLNDAYSAGDFVLESRSSLDSACAHLSQGNACDIVLLDLSLPDSQGIDTIKRIKACAPQLPMVVLSGNGDESVAIASVVAGAQDYLVKGHITAHLLRRALSYAGQRKQIEQSLVHEASHDDLTGLPTRKLLLDRLNQALLSSVREQTRGALLFVDLDGFKQINDRHGHAAGDNVLLIVSERLQQTVRAVDTVARVGGDEFVILLPVIDRNEHIGEITRRIARAFAPPVHRGEVVIPVSASIGGAIFPDEGDSALNLLNAADAAMYRAKAAWPPTLH